MADIIAGNIPGYVCGRFTFRKAEVDLRQEEWHHLKENMAEEKTSGIQAGQRLTIFENMKIVERKSQCGRTCACGRTA
jgi:hypothetical protein